MNSECKIGRHLIGKGHPTFIIAELSANHHHNLDAAIALIHAAKNAGADAVKFQTYTADTITLKSDKDYFRIQAGTLWDGRTLYDLYEEAYTPWDWFPVLFDTAREVGLEAFSSPFDESAVEFLEQFAPVAYKVASLELVDLPLIKRVARNHVPILLSTGAGSEVEIRDALEAVSMQGNEQAVLLKCTSAYPARPEDMNLATLADMRDTFHCQVGLSDHSVGIAVPAAAVALGAVVIEKHLTMHRSEGGPDSAFSLEPSEFKAMVEAVRVVERAIGNVCYAPAEREAASHSFRPSLFVVSDIRKGELFTHENVKSIRPNYGLAPRFIDDVIGRAARGDIERGTPLSRDHIENDG